MSSVWAECPVTSFRPTAKGGHASTVVNTGMGHALIVIGGSDPFGVAVNEVQRIDIPTDPTDRKFKCTTIQENTTQCPFLARMGHSAHSLGANVAQQIAEALGGGVPSPTEYCSPIAIFGGASMIPEPRAHDGLFLLYVLRDLSAELEKPTRDRLPLVRWLDITPSLKGKLPSGRHAHCSCLLGPDQSRLLVAAGSTGEALLKCFHILNFTTLTWEQVSTGADMPPREMASVYALGDGTALVFGGRDENAVVRGDIWRLQGCALTKEAKGFVSRCCHTTVPKGTNLVAVGGFSVEGMPVEDVVVEMGEGNVPATSYKAVRRVVEKDGELHFGLGHSAAVEPLSGRSFIVGGIHPNAVNGSMHVYELQ